MKTSFRDKIDASAVIIVNDSDQILILKRSDNVGSFDGFWNFPGGGSEDGEDSFQCVIRECFEETNLKLKKGDLLYLGAFNIDNNERIKDLHYFITSKYKGEVKLDWENVEYKWIDCSEIKEYNFIPLPKPIMYIMDNKDIFKHLVK